MKIIAVIGKNYGDEGKGLVTASLCSLYEYPLIVKHNGGAQAGHTVEDEEKGTRFIHHQIGSGTEYGADTLLAESFHPDLYQIEKEAEEFREQFGFLPAVYAEAEACITTIDDVLINMALETQRGDSRHGSCGMGINECNERISEGYKITLTDVATLDGKSLFQLLKRIREEYTFPRIAKLKIDNSNPYHSMLCDDNMLKNYADTISNNIRYIQIITADYFWLGQYDGIIFETGQGLLLDKDYLINAPHLTASKTGIAETVNFLRKRELNLNEIIYVTRTYVTKHGAGPLSNEFEKSTFSGISTDNTNAPNEWQGRIRYAKHPSVSDFMKPILEDINTEKIKPSLAITHLNETNGKILFSDGNVSVDEFYETVSPYFDNIYVSWDRKRIDAFKI